MSNGRPSPSPWRDAPGLRWLTVLAALCAGLGLVGMPWQDASERVAAPGGASFDSNSIATPNARNDATVATAADPLSAMPVAPVTPAAARRTTERNASGAGQATSTVTWTSTQFQPIVISGGGLTASAGSGGTHTALASRGVAEGRHYLELTLSIPPGEGGPSTWGGVGVVAMSGLEHGRVLLPRMKGGLAVSVGRNRKLRDGDVVMLAIDLNQELAFWGLNGEWMNGVPGAQGGESLQGNAGEQWSPFVNVTASERNRTPPEGGERWIANFGASPFKYALPGGFDSYGSLAASSQRAAPSSTSSAGPAPPPPAPPAPDALMGKRFKDLIKVQAQVVPLPSGSWTVLAHFRNPGGGPRRGDAVVLGNIEGNKLLGAIAINAWQRSAGADTAAFEACNRQDYVFRKLEAYDAQGEQRCWWINHAVALWQNEPVFQAAKLELERLGVSAPPVMLNVAIRRADATGFATTFYYFNPAEDGIASAAGTWANSEWHRSRIDADPARRAYVQKLQRWGESWAPIYFVSK